MELESLLESILDGFFLILFKNVFCFIYKIVIIIFCLLMVLFDGLTTLKSSGFFCPSDFLSPYFFEYTNDDPLKTNFRFIDTSFNF